MRIDITPLLKSVGMVIKIDETEEVSFPDDGLILTSPLKVSGEFTNTGRLILFTGAVKTRAKVNCRRCLAEMEYPISFKMEEAYSRDPIPKARGKKRELTDEDFVFEVESDNSIDLKEAVRQDLLTELPMAPLCKENCKGVN